MKKDSLEGTNPIAEIESLLMRSFDILRAKISTDEYYVILYLLFLKREGILNKLVSLEFRMTRSILTNADQNVDQNDKVIRVIFGIFEKVLYSIDDHTLRELIILFDSIDQKVLESNFPTIFESTLYTIIKFQGKFGGGFLQPAEITRFICRQANLNKSSKVFNPFAGLASFDVLSKVDYDYFGQEYNHTVWALGTLRLMAYNRLGSSKYVNADSIEYWPSDDQTFDLIVSNPPFGVKLANQYNWLNPEIRTAEQFLIEKGISSLNNKGKLIAVLSNGLLFRGGAEQLLRKKLIESDFIETIISLPGGLLMNTGIPIFILVINRDKNLKDKVRFIDAQKLTLPRGKKELILNDEALSSIANSDKDSEFVRIITKDQIREFEYNLNVPLYFQKKYQGVKLNEIVSVINGQRNYEEQSGKFIRIRDLKEDKIDFQLETDSIEDCEIPKPALKISTSCLLVATRWKTIKPTYFTISEDPIFVTPDIISLKVDESKVDIAYLINELQSEYISEQIDSFRIGASVPSFRRDDLLKVVIKLPNLLEQKAKIKGITEAMAEQKKADLISFSKIHGLEKEAYEQNTHLRHTLAGPTSNLVSSLAHIKSIIIDKIAPIYPEILGQKVSDDHLFSLADYLDFVERDALKISETVRRQLKVDDIFESKLLSPLDIVDFLKVFFAEKSENNDLDFIIDFGFDKESFLDDITESEIKTVILANVDLLTDMFNNLIENTVKHAFSAGNKNRLEVYVMKDNITDSNPEIQILFSNTGKPFPEDFGFDDFIRKGSKSGSNAGDGYGGWYVNEIIKYHKGSFDFIDETGSEGLPGTDLVTSFEINFPIIEIDE